VDLTFGQALHSWRMSGVIVLTTKKKCPFCEVVKMCNGLHHCVPLVKMVKKTYMELPIWGPDERVMPPRKCSVIGTSGPHLSRNFRHKLELPARIRAGTPGSSLNFRYAPESELPAQAWTSDMRPSRNFRPEPELPANLIKRVVRVWPFGFRSELF
jgi:hypothetical protein